MGCGCVLCVGVAGYMECDMGRHSALALALAAAAAEAEAIAFQRPKLASRGNSHGDHKARFSAKNTASHTGVLARKPHIPA